MKHNKTVSEEHTAQVVRVDDIKDERIISVLQAEGLSVDATRRLCREIDYQDKNGKISRGYGMQNISGGHSIITIAKATINIGVGDIAVIKGDGADLTTCLLFAGLRDYLAYHTLYGNTHCDTLIMFSTALAKKAARYISSHGYEQIIYYAPNSTGKTKSMPILRKTGIMIWDMSPAYAGYKDLRKYCTAWMANLNKHKKS